MITRTTTLNNTGCTTRNSINAGHRTDIAFGHHSTLHPIHSSNRNNSDRTATNNHGNGYDPSDDDQDNGDDILGDPEDPSDDPNNFNNDVQHNLADVIAALAKNMKHQGDGSRSKVREPDPFDGTDPTKL
jgi:hypothetical protein